MHCRSQRHRGRGGEEDCVRIAALQQRQGGQEQRDSAGVQRELVVPQAERQQRRVPGGVTKEVRDDGDDKPCPQGGAAQRAHGRDERAVGRGLAEGNLCQRRQQIGRRDAERQHQGRRECQHGAE